MENPVFDSGSAARVNGKDCEPCKAEAANEAGFRRLSSSFSSRRFLVIGIIALVVMVVIIVVVVAVCIPRAPSTPIARAKAVLQRVPLIDGHNDLPWQLRENYKNQLAQVDLSQREPWAKKAWGKGYGHTSIPLLREGGVGAQFWAAYMGCSSQGKDALHQVVEQIDVIKRFVDAYDDDFEFVTTADGILQAHERGKIGSLIGVEGGHAIESSLAGLRTLYELGVRYMTITHSCNTPWADNWKVDNTVKNDTDPSEHDGLDSFGKKVIVEMNRLGMLVDLSHVSHKHMEVALDTTKSPVIFSHSSAYTICNHNRNVRDDILRRVKQNGGIVMVNFYSNYINCAPNEQENATLEQVAAHLSHMKNVMGADHVGLGSDYDGVDELPIGLENVSKFPALLAALAEAGWTDEELEKLAGRNLIRVFQETERVAASMKLSGIGPNDDLIPKSALTQYESCRSEDALE